MNIRERLYEIPDLVLDGRLSLMSDEHVSGVYKEILLAFTDNFPSVEIALRAALKDRDVKRISALLIDLRETLAEMYADKLADECWNKLNNFDPARLDKVEAYVIFLLSTLTALSIDIQAAYYRDEHDDGNDEADIASKKDSPIKTILAVDDDPYCLDIFKAALKDMDYRVIGTTSGVSALSAMNKITPDLFVLDIDMPGMNGIELAREIKALGNAAPIVFITGNATKEFVLTCMDAGARDFITKPINPQMVAERIGRIRGALQ